MKGSKVIFTVIAALLIISAGGLPASAGQVTFDELTNAPANFTDVTPGTGFGPVLTYSDVTFNYGVVLQNLLATTSPNLYATSDTALLSNNETINECTFRTS